MLLPVFRHHQRPDAAADEEVSLDAHPLGLVVAEHGKKH